MRLRSRNTKRRKGAPASGRATKRKVPAWAGSVALSFLAAVLAGGYLAQIGTTASKGHAIRSLQNEIAELKEEKDRLEFQVAKDRSMAAVEEKVSSMGMVPVREIEYMTATDGVVAKR